MTHLQFSLFTIRAEFAFDQNTGWGDLWKEGREYDRCTDHLYLLVLTEMCSSLVVRACLATMRIWSVGGGGGGGGGDIIEQKEEVIHDLRASHSTCPFVLWKSSKHMNHESHSSLPFARLYDCLLSTSSSRSFRMSNHTVGRSFSVASPSSTLPTPSISSPSPPLLSVREFPEMRSFRLSAVARDHAVHIAQTSHVGVGVRVY